MTDWMVNLQVNQLTRTASRLSPMCTLVRIRRTYTLSFARVELDGISYFILVTWRKSRGFDGVEYMVGEFVLTNVHLHPIIHEFWGYYRTAVTEQAIR